MKEAITYARTHTTSSALIISGSGAEIGRSNSGAFHDLAGPSDRRKRLALFFPEAVPIIQFDSDQTSRGLPTSLRLFGKAES